MVLYTSQNLRAGVGYVWQRGFFIVRPGIRELGGDWGLVVTCKVILPWPTSNYATPLKDSRTSQECHQLRTKWSIDEPVRDRSLLNGNTRNTPSAHVSSSGNILSLFTTNRSCGWRHYLTVSRGHIKLSEGAGNWLCRSCSSECCSPELRCVLVIVCPWCLLSSSTNFFSISKQK